MKQIDKKLLGGALLATTILMGGFHANATTATFVFDAPAEAMSTFEAWQNWIDDISGDIVDNQLTVNFAGLGEFAFSVEDPYTMIVEAPSNLTEGVDYSIEDYGSYEGFYSIAVVLGPETDGAEFKIIIPNGEEPGEGGETTEMDPGIMLFPEVNVNGDVSLADFGTSIFITYGFQQIFVISDDPYEDMVIASIVNPEGTEMEVGGYVIPYDPSISGNPSVTPGDEMLSGNRAISFSIISAAMPGFPFDMNILTGEYIFTIPQGIVKNEKGEVNPEQTIRFNVIEGKIIVTDVTFEFEAPAEAMETLLINDYASQEYIQSKIKDNKLDVSFYYGYNTYSFNVSDEYVMSIIPPADLIEGEDYYIFDGMDDPNRQTYDVIIELYEGANGSTFNVVIKDKSGTSGIETIENNNGYVIYNLNGVEVLRTTDYNELKTLMPGIYIVNGKKLVIR